MRRALLAASLLVAVAHADMPAMAQITVDKLLGGGLAYQGNKIVPNFGTQPGTVARGDASPANVTASQNVLRSLLPTISADGNLHVLDANGQDHVFAPASASATTSTPSTPGGHAASVDNTSVTAPGTPLYDGLGHTLTLVTSASSGLQIAINGVTDTTTNNVAQLTWISNGFHQLNSLGAWYTEPVTGGPGTSETNPLPSGTSTVPTGGTAQGGAITLAAPGGTDATKDGSTFSWINQGNASLSGGGAAQLEISDPDHPNTHNLRMLAANLPTTSATYTTLVINPMTGSIYNGGMFLSQGDGSGITTLQAVYGNETGSNLSVIGYSNPQGAGENDVFVYQNQGFAAVNTRFFMRIVYDAIAKSYTFLASGSGGANSWVVLATQSAAVLGNPTRIGFHSDADDQGGGYNSGNPGRFDVVSFAPTAGASPQSAAAGGDSTKNFLTSVNNPLSDIPPVIPSITGPGDGLVMQAGTTNVLNMVFGSGQAGVNIPDEATLRKYVYMNYDEGGLNTALGSPMDTGQGDNQTFAAVARHYPVGDPNSTTPVLSDGLHMKAFCTNNHADCSPGSVYGGYVRFTPAIRAGMTIKVRYKAPAGYHSWVAKWLFTGEQRTPGPGGDAYQNNGALNDYPVTNHNFEIDMCDCFQRKDDGNTIASGSVLDFQTPDIYGNAWPSGKSPYISYQANDGQFAVDFPNAGPPFVAFPNLNWANTFHDLVMNWRTDGFIDIYVDGREAMQGYMDYADLATTDQAGKPLGLNFMIGNQAIPGFSLGAYNYGANPTNAGISDNDGITVGPNEVANPGGWTEVIQEVSIWQGNVANPDSHR